MSLSADRCEHFSLCIGSFRLPGDLSRVFAPVESCELCVAVLGSAGEAMPAQVYGPDGRLATRGTCTTVRRDAACLPALAAERLAARAAERQGTLLEADGVRAESRRLRAQARAAAQQARSLARDARAVADRAAELVRDAQELTLACQLAATWGPARAAVAARAGFALAA